MNETILTAKNLKVIMGDAILVSIDAFDIKRGETVAIIGPNGAGKSTLILALAALIKPTEGEIIYQGRKIDFARSTIEFKRQLAMVFQEPLLFDTTVLKNVASGLKGNEAHAGPADRGEIHEAFQYRSPVRPLGKDAIGRRGTTNQSGPRPCHGTGDSLS